MALPVVLEYRSIPRMFAFDLDTIAELLQIACKAQLPWKRAGAVRRTAPNLFQGITRRCGTCAVQDGAAECGEFVRVVDGCA